MYGASEQLKEQFNVKTLPAVAGIIAPESSDDLKDLKQFTVNADMLTYHGLHQNLVEVLQKTGRDLDSLKSNKMNFNLRKQRRETENEEN